MRRRSGRWIALLSLIVFGGLIALVVTGRGTLQNDTRQVTERWAPLQAPLSERYARLTEAADAVAQTGGDREITGEITTGMRAWEIAVRRRTLDPQVAAANELEGLSRRLAATVAGSPKLSADPDVQAALGAFSQTRPPEELVKAFDDATQNYAQSRTSIGQHLAASLFRYEARPALRLT